MTVINFLQIGLLRHIFPMNERSMRPEFWINAPPAIVTLIALVFLFYYSYRRLRNLRETWIIMKSKL
jgi:hypothetical protein